MLSSVKSRLGELWWYALILFCVQRIGDVINVFIGLWLVPRYVPQAELGAVLPLAQIGGVLGLPIAILLIPFGKFLNVYAARGELGKVKSLLRDVFLLAAVLGGGIVVGARYVMPHVFERLRVQSGLLVWLIVLAGVTSALSPLFVQALQALKKFRQLSFAGVIGATIRLLVLVVTLPIRGLSGYFCGQLASDGSGILCALAGLKEILSRKVRPEPYLHHWRELAGYIGPVATLVIFGRIQSAAEFFVIRHQLPEVESAAYYFITRFAEIPVSLSGALVAVFFSLVSERHEKGEAVSGMFRQTLFFVLLVGGGLTAALHVLAPHLFGMVAAWQPYGPYLPLMGVAAATCVLQGAFACFITYELACRRFAFVWYTSAIYVLKTILLYGLAGISYFEHVIPNDWIQWIHDAEIMNLHMVVRFLFVVSALLMGIASFQSVALKNSVKGS